MKKTLLTAAVLAGLALAGCNMHMEDSFAPVTQMSYAPHSEHYIGYVNGFTGTDTHTFELGDRSFVIRGTPPLAGTIEPWYDWNDMENVGSKPLSFENCGACNLAMGAEVDIHTQNLAGHDAHLEICYSLPQTQAPLCFAGDKMHLASDVKDWKKLSVTAPFDKFRQLTYTKARIRLVVDGGREPNGHAGFEGVIWADNFHFVQAQPGTAGNVNLKLSGALWPDDYSGWYWDRGEPKTSLQAEKH